MANIKKHLDNIKGALFGKDVRSSIHDGIDAINKEVENTTGRQVDLENTFDQLVINAGNSNAEIVDARVKSDGTSYSKLGDRLNEVDSQLEQKAYKSYITPEEFGAKSDGIADDTKAIKDCFEYAINNNCYVQFKGKKIYCISENITITENINIDFNNSTLKAINNIDYVLFFELTLNSNNNTIGTIKNLLIDCNNQADIGLVINTGKKGCIKNIEVINAKIKAYEINTCHELDGTTLRAENCPIFMTNNSTDTNFRGLYARNCNIGIQNFASSNYYTDVHFWNDSETYKNSVFMQLKQPCFLINGYIDTYETSYEYLNSTSFFIDNCKYSWNETLVDIQSKPIIFKFTNFINASDRLVITKNYIIGATSGVLFSDKEVNELLCAVDDTSRFYRVEKYKTYFESDITLNDNFTVVYKYIQKKENRVCVTLKLKHTGIFTQNTQTVACTLTDSSFNPSESIIVNGYYSIDDGYSVDGVSYVQLAGNGDFRVKYPRISSSSSTELYIYMNFCYDVN